MSIRSVALFSALCLSLSLHALQPSYADAKPENKNLTVVKYTPTHKISPEVLAYHDELEAWGMFVDTFSSSTPSAWNTESTNVSYRDLKGKTIKTQTLESEKLGKNFLSNSAYKAEKNQLYATTGVHTIDTIEVGMLPLSYVESLGSDDLTHFVITPGQLPAPPLTFKKIDRKTNTVTFEASAAPLSYALSYIKTMEYHFIDAKHLDITLYFHLKQDTRKPYAIEKLRLTKIAHDHTYNN